MPNEPRLVDNQGRTVECEIKGDQSPLSEGTKLTVTVSVTEPVRVDRVVWPLELHVDQVLEHGFQSWSSVRRCLPNDVRASRREAPRWFRGQMLADRDSAGRDISGDTFLVHNLGVVGFLGASRTFTRLRVDREGYVEAQWLFDGVLIEPGEPLELEALWVGEGLPGPLYSLYAQLAGDAMGARVARTLPRAWCSWYQYFDRVTPDDVRENLPLAVAHGVDVVQIDDGWQREIGVWDEVNPRWGQSMSAMADEIRTAGATPGIWTAPFLAIENGSLATEHPDWLVRNESGRPTTALHHEGWGGNIFALDTTHPDVIEHLVSVYRALRESGYEYFKIDFCHAAAAVGSRFDERATRAVALRRGLEAVRAGIGEDAYLLGCGCPLLSAVGIVDAMRVSEDVAPHWEPRLYFPGFEEVTVSARNAVAASLLRSPLHRRWFALDPDCVLLREVDTELSDSERAFIGAVAVASGGFIVLSDRLSLYRDEQWAQVRWMFGRTDDGERNLRDPFAQTLEVMWDKGTGLFNWETQTYELTD